MATWWTPQKVWQGQTAAILACGPSLAEGDARRVQETGIRALAVNDAFRLAPWADVLYAADAVWWRVHAQDALKFPGLKVTIGDNCEFPAVLALQHGGCGGFDERPSHLRTGQNSAYQALHLAVHMGATRILLLGLDLKLHKGKPSHFFGDHPPKLRRDSPYTSFITHFEHVAPIYRKRGVEIINCTLASALDCFPKQPLEDALAGIPASP